MDIRERILGRAQELFNRYGFRKVTMDEIAFKTGMSKKTIYQCFATKDEIVDAFVEELITKSVSSCRKSSIEAENVVHEAYLNIDMMKRLMTDMNPIVLDDLEKFFPAVFAKFFEHKHNFISEKVKVNLEAGIKEGFYRSDLNVDVITKFRLETMFVPFNQNVFPYSEYSLIDVQIEILELFLYGICTPKGQELIEKYKQQRLNNK
jgi:predicted DNA-binding protein YlxM (UPF0122 family)